MAPLDVIGAGAATPVGLGYSQSCTAIRAGVAAFAESEFFLWTTTREPIVAAAVPLRPTPIESRPVGRLSTLARIALRECLRETSVDSRRTALLLGAPSEQRAQKFREWFDEDLYSGLFSRVVRAFHSASEILPHGNVSVLAGLRRAQDLLDKGIVEQCIVGGVDSLLNPPDLERLEHSWRLHREGESYGLVPGEAAAFVVVAPHGLPQRSPVVGTILGIGAGRESAEHCALSNGHPTGMGLEQALSAAITDAGLPEAAVGLRVSDLNGERYGAMDSLLAMSRFYRSDRNGLPIWHPAECTGETGAASGAILIQVACHALSCGYAPATHVMCELSSDEGHRAACVIQAAG